MLKKLSKPKVWLPILAGLVIAGTLFLMGENDDAPGLVMLGFAASIILFGVGVNNFLENAKNCIILAVVCFCFAALSVAWMIMLYIEGEYEDSPGVGLLQGLVVLALLVIGVKLLRQKK